MISSSPGPQRPSAVLAWGIWGAVFALLLELCWVLWWGRTSFTGSWEVWNGALGLGPAWLLLAAGGGIYGGALALCLGAERPLLARSSFAFLLGVVAGCVAWGVGGGRHLSSGGARAGFAVLVLLVSTAGAALAYPSARRCVQGGLRARGVALALGGGAALLCAAINRAVLVRLYPAFHLGLTLLQLSLAGLCAALWFGARSRSPWATWGAVGLIVLAGLGLPSASHMARGFDNFRWVVSESSPTLGWGVEVASLLAPPEPPSLEWADQPLGARRARSTGVDLRGRSILLVSVDALRADHVGAYGASRGATPVLDALAAQGVLFEAAYAATPHTSYSLTSLMTGKYMRPLLQQGAGADSDLWPELLRTYGYKTAAFYPPAVFFIDGERFASFRDRQLGFEYAKVEFAEGQKRVSQIEEYLGAAEADTPLFVWLHLFGPHEPYEPQIRDFGPRDIDRYDSEVHAADDTLGKVVALFQKRDPRGVVIVTADHGEEFGDHGGRYHGTSVYDEQVRVPLVIVGPGFAAGRRIRAPVQTIDLFPTVLAGLSIPVPPRIRGRDLLPGLSEHTPQPHKALDPGRALAETEDYALLAEGPLRLICARRSGACQLFDTGADPAQRNDVGGARPEAFLAMRETLRALSASHGVYETAGLRSEGKGWPGAILRGLSGDAEVAPELGALLDDADVNIRRKSAELLFRIDDPGQASALRLALSREGDDETRRFLALALTRRGQGAPLVHEMLHEESRGFRRLAALALAEQGDRSGEDELVAWWTEDKGMEFEQALELLGALSVIKSKKAVGPLVARLGDVRLRPHIAQALATLGDEDARPALARALLGERYVSARLPLARALLALGGKSELVVPLIRFLGVPDPLEGGLGLALEAGVLEGIGGPTLSGLGRLRQLSDSGVQVELTVPHAPRATGTRLLVLARGRAGEDGQLLVARGQARRSLDKKEPSVRKRPEIDEGSALRVVVPVAPVPQQLAVTIPASWGARPGQTLVLDLFGDRHSEVLALAVVPLAEELPPPPPEPWEKPAPTRP